MTLTTTASSTARTAERHEPGEPGGTKIRADPGAKSLDETHASEHGWRTHPGLVLDFYNERRREISAAKPNAAHYGLASLEDDFDVHIVTTNIDDLHERAGSTHVIHLHGNIMKKRSEKARHTRLYDITGDIHLGDVAEDGGQLMPDIVWFGEPVPEIGPAAALAASADIFVVIGTPLSVYPAAGLVDFVRPRRRSS